jgi:hypothetical protein
VSPLTSALAVILAPFKRIIESGQNLDLAFCASGLAGLQILWRHNLLDSELKLGAFFELREGQHNLMILIHAYRLSEFVEGHTLIIRTNSWANSGPFPSKSLPAPGI